MDFTFSEEQDELAGLTRKILAQRGVAGHGVRGIPGGAECPPGQAERDTPERQWADLAAAGVLAAGLPTSLGGAGLGLLEHCSVLAEIGRVVSDVPYLASIVLGPARSPSSARRRNGPGGLSRLARAQSSSPPRWRRRTATATHGPRRPPQSGRPAAGRCPA